MVLGFAPFKRARAGMGVTLLLMLVIAAPLSMSFSHLVAKDQIMEQIPRGTLELSGLTLNVRGVRVSLSEPHLVTLVVSADRLLEATDADELKELITERVGEPIILEVQSNIRP